MVAFDLLKGVINAIFGDPFEMTPMEKAVNESIENMDKMQKAAVDTQAAMLAAGSSIERAFIGIRAGTGFVGQVAGEFSGLAKTIADADTEKVDKLKRELSGDLGFFEGSEVGRGEAIKERNRRVRAGEALPPGRFEQQISAIRQEMRENLLAEAMGGTQGATAEVYLRQLKSAQTNLQQLVEKGIQVAPDAFSLLDAEIKRVDALGKSTVVAGATILKFGVDLDKTQDKVKRFLGAFDGMSEAITNNDVAFRKLTEKSATKFTPLVQSAEALNGIFKTMATDFPDGVKVIDDKTGEEKTLSILEAINASDDEAAKALKNKLVESEKYKEVLRLTGSEAEALAAASQKFTDDVIKADESARGLAASIKENKVAVKEMSRFSKNNLAIYNEEILLRKEGIQLQIQQIENELTLLATRKGEEGVAERVAQLTKDKNALMSEQTDLGNDIVAQKQAEFNETKRIADIENKLLGIRREAFNIRMQELATAEARENRENSRQFGFEFVDQGRTEINQKIDREQEKLRFELTTQKEIDQIKKTMIEAEYALLAAKLRAEAEIARKKAGDIEPERIEDFTRIDSLNASGTRLDALATKLETAETKAVENVDRATEARIAGIRETILSLRDAKEELEPMQQVLAGFEETMTIGMQNAITGLISGTTTAREALSSLVGSMIQVINEMIARLIVARILASAIFGGSLGGNQVDGAGFDAGSGVMNTYDFNSNPGGQLVGRYGGVFSNGSKVPGYAMGGIASGSQAGYPAVLHGTEAVVPLPNNRSIPVDLKGSGQQMNNVTVNVAIDGEGNAKQDQQANTNQGAELGKIIATAVQQQLLEEKRSGGILNPYGVS